MVQPLSTWHDFYQLAGTASATFVALLFVAASVGSGIWERRDALRIFLTATVVHFSSILFVSLGAIAPLHNAVASGLFIVLVAGVGTTYGALVLRDLLHHGLGAAIDMEDRIYYAALPVVGHLLMGLAGILLALQIAFGGIVLGVAVLLLMVTGIRNAWDITVWIIMRPRN